MTVLVKLASDAGVHLAEINVLAAIARGACGTGLGTRRAGACLTRHTAVRRACHAERAWPHQHDLYMGSITLLPLAEATTLGFTTPIFATILAAIVLGEKVGKHRTCGGACGLHRRPSDCPTGRDAYSGNRRSGWPDRALSVAITSLQIRDMGRTEGAATTVFWFSALSNPPNGVVAALFHHAT